MKRFASFIFTVFILCFHVNAQKIMGVVNDLAGNVLPYSSITIKNKPGGTTANAEGKFVLKLPPGSYTIICQHVGYQLQEKEIILAENDLSLQFQLSPLRLTLAEVVVKKGEDPAYEIIRQAIKKRPEHRKELPKFTAEVYTKGMLKLRDFPKKFMGQEIDFEDGDTGKKKMIYLSETVSRYSVEGRKMKVEVMASKVSGDQGGFGLSAPSIISFYENNISIGENLNPRGFISPIADNALNFYNYKYMGGFFENGLQISRIKVTPKRKFEPLFNGFINIIDDQWRIHSVELTLLKQYGLQTLDTVRIEQLYAPLSNGAWVVKNQVIYPAIRMFSFDAYGSFLNVYSNYDVDPVFSKGFFDKTILKYTDSANKKTISYWDETRPVSLQKEEVEDYRKKDSLEQVRRSPAYLDSIDKRRNKLSFSKLLYTGVNLDKQKKHSVISFPSLVQAFSYNTVEGLVADLNLSYRKRFDTSNFSGRSLAVNPELRYGFSNNHFNYNVETHYGFGNRHRNRISLAGGTNVFQFNNQNPANILVNTITTLFAKLNTLKIYEAAFFRAGFSRELDGGLYWSTSIEYQDRKPLDNTTDFSFNKEKEKAFSPNYPLPAVTENISRHQAFNVSVSMRWQPGSKYIEFPGRRYSVGSKYPVLSAGLTKSLPGVFGSDLSFSKWKFSVSDRMDFRLFGSFNYLLSVGGFFNHDSVTVPDYTHFKGNPTVLAESYSGRFQLVPHYYFSNKNSFYGVGFAEHHFNGLLTNKIPLLKQLKWNLVTGANGLLLNSGRYYIEPYVGLENIFRILRIDYVTGYEKDKKLRTGFRVGLQTSFNNR